MIARRQAEFLGKQMSARIIGFAIGVDTAASWKRSLPASTRSSSDRARTAGMPKPMQRRGLLPLEHAHPAHNGLIHFLDGCAASTLHPPAARRWVMCAASPAPTAYRLSRGH